MADEEINPEEWSEVQGVSPKSKEAEVPKRRKASNLVSWVSDLVTAYIQARYPGKEMRYRFTVSVSVYNSVSSNDRYDVTAEGTSLPEALHAFRGKILEQANTLYTELRTGLAEQTKRAIELAERTQTLKEICEERKP